MRDEWASDGWTETTTHTLASTAPSRGAGRAGWGVPGWLALLVLLAIAGMGGLIDVAGGSSLTGWFNVALIIASAVAILIVRHSNMFTIVVAPPLVYFLASGGMIYIRSHGLHNHKVLRDDAINLLVYGFPAIAGATAAVLIVAGVRVLIRR